MKNQNKIQKPTGRSPSKGDEEQTPIQIPEHTEPPKLLVEVNIRILVRDIGSLEREAQTLRSVLLGLSLPLGSYSKLQVAFAHTHIKLAMNRLTEAISCLEGCNTKENGTTLAQCEG